MLFGQTKPGLYGRGGRTIGYGVIIELWLLYDDEVTIQILVQTRPLKIRRKIVIKTSKTMLYSCNMDISNIEPREPYEGLKR